MPATHNWAIFDRIAIRVMLGIDIVKYVPPHVNISIGFGTFTSPTCVWPSLGWYTDRSQRRNHSSKAKNT